ncbi:hypothetical protein [Phormidium sp. CCY1219]|uniref:hypothetical protein n=1 Tax=Phormidium sp. CCY1219 TaxID=2886104 RepID=UPI002D1F8BA2|nr:hypothetical protein [Phormidium sp. CCY1219]MEB3830636.1 hypothetical protein [Phormidium sp. CCY1219]
MPFFPHPGAIAIALFYLFLTLTVVNFDGKCRRGFSSQCRIKNQGFSYLFHTVAYLPFPLHTW